MNTRAFLGALAALSLASACPEAQAQVQASQSGWQWGNPTPQGNTIRALDFIAGRGYAIGDDGTALRTDDGGATWTGLATGTSQDLTRVQAVTPDVSWSSAATAASSAAPTTAARRSARSTSWPRPTARKGLRRVLRHPAGRLPAAAQRQRPAHHRRRRVLRPRHRDPRHAGQLRRRPGRPRRRDLHHPRRRRRLPRGTNTAFRTTDAGASWTPEPDVETGSVQRMQRGQRLDLLRLRPRHAAALHRRRPDVAAPRRRATATRSPASAARPTTSAC